MLSSCAPDAKPLEEKAVPSKKVTAVAKAAKKKTASSKNTASSSDIINHRDVDIYLLADLIHKEINKVKKANGLPLLKKDKVLKNAATDQNNYQIRIGDISHTQKTSKKENVGDRVSYYGGGFQAMSENVMYEGFIIRSSGNKKEIIAPSYAAQAKKMVRSWMNSPSHRKNIMNPKYDRVGTAAGYHGELHAVFATQVFGKKF
ncbi:CAP domain-containing protein [Portibacter lacus]|uniref:SCP domain-containing protein n=1 Tax=Portibacter lacus TaxID=1099794 RepID=A0AA37SW04_9BACT|nr:CAP domain-containing protein [Portibacter lacus]GLR18725.1 hypothetical protein GCM10007940_33410 [Portibacter lacus]